MANCSDLVLSLHTGCLDPSNVTVTTETVWFPGHTELGKYAWNLAQKDPLAANC